MGGLIFFIGVVMLLFSLVGLVLSPFAGFGGLLLSLLFMGFGHLLSQSNERTKLARKMAGEPEKKKGKPWWF